VKWILKYLHNTPHMKLFFSDDKLTLRCTQI